MPSINASGSASVSIPAGQVLTISQGGDTIVTLSTSKQPFEVGIQGGTLGPYPSDVTAYISVQLGSITYKVWSGSNAVTSTTDASGNPIITQGNLNQRRKILSERFAASPLVKPPSWTAGEVVVQGNVRLTSLGKYIVCQVSGTCGTVEPVFGGTSRITASVGTTTTLTVTAVSGDPIGVGTEIISSQVTSGTKISALGTGTGGAGTYVISGNFVATVASTDMGVMTNPIGRRFVDNTATWELDYQWKNSFTASGAPVAPIVTFEPITLNVTSSPLGFVRYLTTVDNFTNGGPVINIKAKAGAVGNTPFKTFGFDFRVNTTGGYSGAIAYGYPAGMTRGSSFEFVTYITDSVFMIECNAGSRMVVDIDGYIVEANPTILDGGNSRLIKFDFRGDFRQRKISIRLPDGNDCIGAFHLSPLGNIQAGGSSTDTLLMFGDSVFNATSPTGSSMHATLPYLLQKSLGFEAGLCANVGGTGYIATGGPFNFPQLLADVTNKTIFSSINAMHVVVCHGLNDAGAGQTALQAVVLPTLQALRTLLPNAKITIFDPWYQSTSTQFVGDVIQSAFNTWADTNSRFCSFNGRTGRAPLAATTATGIGGSSLPLTNGGGALNIIRGTDSTHPPQSATQVYAQFMVDQIRAAWGDNY